jgi:hypothetical protein
VKKPKIKNPKAKPYKTANRELSLNGPINKVTRVARNKKKDVKPSKGE